MNANLFRRGFGVHGAESIQRVQRRNFVALRKCRIVENRVHKIIQTAAQRQHCLANVHNFRGLASNAMHAQKFARIAVENKFQHALIVTATLSARTFGIPRHANFIGELFFMVFRR